MRCGQEVDAADARVRAVAAERAELLLDLADVAVGEDPVRLDALVHLAELEVRLGVAAGARDAALRVHDEVGDEPGAGERGEREDRRRRVAARGADDGARPRPIAAELLAVQLGQAVDGGREQVRPRVLEVVPARVVGGVAEPEVGAEVDHRLPASEELVDPARDRAVGEGEEHRLGAVGDRVEHLEVARREVRVDARDRVAPAARGRPGPTISTLGWSASSRIELRAHVPGRAHDRDAHGIAAQRPLPDGCRGAAARGLVMTARLDRRLRLARAHGRAEPLAGGSLEGSEIGRNVVTE